MPHTIRWYDVQQRHLLVTTTERFPHEEIMQMLQTALEMRESGALPGCLILDMRQVRRTEPFRANHIRAYIQHPLSQHPRHQGTHLVLGGSFALIFVNAIKRVFPSVLTLMTVHGKLADVDAKLGLHPEDLAPAN
jgi:hypothetical protein